MRAAGKSLRRAKPVSFAPPARRLGVAATVLVVLSNKVRVRVQSE